jgi:BirA family biotin operon repressor/biotin-[acetyl-CoA-carboxylase] ligase
VTPGATRVLEALRSTRSVPCSGEALSTQLDVSRTQIWKHVETLRARGYEIEGAAGGGYRFVSAPDRLYPEEIQNGLETRWMARTLQHFETIDSTNRLAMELGRQGAAHGTTVVAESQSAGRGRLGRAFFSPAHQNLYSSTVLRPRLSTADAPTLILTAAVAVADAIAASLDDATALEIKWPNDVLLGGLKTSGILMEMSAEAARVGFVVLGIGVNLNVERSAFPEEFRHAATSLRAHSGAPVDRVAFARCLYRCLEEAMDVHAAEGFEALRPRFEARFRMPGKRIRVHELDGSEQSGTARGIAADGSLEIERDDGSLGRVVAGDVTLAKQARA